MLLCPAINDLEIPDLRRLSNLQTSSSSNYTDFTADFFFLLLELLCISEVILQHTKSMKSIGVVFAIQLESGNMRYSLNTSGKFFTHLILYISCTYLYFSRPA